MPRPMAPDDRALPSKPVPLAAEVRKPVAASVQPVVAAPRAEPVPDPAPAPAPAKTMRSLDEVRADLARLRESAKERHARASVPVRRDISFEPTDFMDFAKPAPAPEHDESFEQTAFLDFTTLKPRS